MNKTYLAGIFACFSIASQLQGLDIRAGFAKHENKFLEFMFIERYNQEKAAINAQAKNIVSLCLGMGLASKLYVLTKNSSPAVDATTTPETKTKHESYAHAFAALLPEANPTNATIALLTALVGYKSYEFYQNAANTFASISVLTSFLDEWNINKEYTPESFHPFFNELAKMYELYGEDIFYDCSSDIVSGLQFIIKRTELKVSEVYKKEFENNASGSSVFDTPKFLNEILKPTKEIVKL